MQIVFLSIAVFFSHMVEGITGFGCMIVALPFVSAALGLKVAIPVLVILSTLFDIALVVKDFHKINWRVALRIMVCAGLLMPLGFWALRQLPEALMMTLLGIFILLVACIGIVQNFGLVPPASDKLKKAQAKLCVVFVPVAGLVQGAFGGSGPFMVLYAQTVLHDKTEFRSTMATVWILLNGINLTQYLLTDMITPQVLHISALLLPAIVAGFAAGILVHKRISQQKFTKLIYGMLLITGISMIMGQ